MPTYEFKCMKCAAKFEELVSSSQLAQLRCPQCGGADLQRVYAGRWQAGTPKRMESCPMGGPGCEGCARLAR